MQIFAHAIFYTLATTFAAALVALGLFILIAPENVPAAVSAAGTAAVPKNPQSLSYYDHFLSVIPDNVLPPSLKAMCSPFW